MNFTNCQVTIHAINNYATVTVSDPSSNTTFDISASNAYSPYYTYQPAYNGSNVCYHPVYTGLSGERVSSSSLGPVGLMGMPSSMGGSGTTGTSMTIGHSDVSRPIYSYYN